MIEKLKYIPVPVVLPVLFSKWPLPILRAAVIWGESRGEIFEAKLGVAWVIENRVTAQTFYGKTHRDVILKKQFGTGGGKFQFSCFNCNDVNLRKMRDVLCYDSWQVWLECYRVGQYVMKKEIKDPTLGATLYHSIKDKKKQPYWTRRPKQVVFTVKIGNLYFYRELSHKEQKAAKKKK